MSPLLPFIWRHVHIKEGLLRPSYSYGPRQAMDSYGLHPREEDGDRVPEDFFGQASGHEQGLEGDEGRSEAPP